MGTKVTDTGGGDFTPAPAGLHRAVCIAYVDLGTQEGPKYMCPGQTEFKQQVVLMWETPDETLEIDSEQKPFVIAKFYTKSIGEKANLCKDLESWRGQAFTTQEREGFDLDKILGAPCQINIVHETKDKKTRAKITAVLPLSKGMAKPSPSIKPWRYDIAEDGQNFPEQLTDGLKKMILKSQEFLNPAKPSTDQDTTDYGVQYDDELPF
jgi:hypothetical protein